MAPALSGPHRLATILSGQNEKSVGDSGLTVPQHTTAASSCGRMDRPYRSQREVGAYERTHDCESVQGATPDRFGRNGGCVPCRGHCVEQPKSRTEGVVGKDLKRLTSGGSLQERSLSSEKAVAREHCPCV